MIQPTGKYSRPHRKIGEQEESTIRGQEQRDRRVEHFEELKNEPILLNPLDILAPNIGLPIDDNMKYTKRLSASYKTRGYTANSRMKYRSQIHSK